VVNIVVDNQIQYKDIKLVVFDKDGTLFDLHKYWSFVIKQRATYFAEKYGHSSKNIFESLTKIMGLVNGNCISKKGPIGIRPRSYIKNEVYNTLQKSGFNLSLNDIDIGFNQVDRLVDMELNSLIDKLPGVDNLIKSLKNLGCYVTLATTDIQQRTIITLKHANMNSTFDFIIASDDVIESKPNREMIDKIIFQFSEINYSQVLLIGDSIVDLEMAKNSGINFIGVKTGTNADEFISSGELMVDYLSDIQLMAE
jgi:phosphoglycolate phosphatase